MSMFVLVFSFFLKYFEIWRSRVYSYFLLVLLLEMCQLFVFRVCQDGSLVFFSANKIYLRVQIKNLNLRNESDTNLFINSQQECVCECISQNVKLFIPRKVSWGWRVFQSQYLSEQFCGHSGWLSIEEDFFFWVCFLVLPDTMLHVSSVYLTLKASGSLQQCVWVCVCACEREIRGYVHTCFWISNNNQPGIQPIYELVCSQRPCALIKSNLIQMLRPPPKPGTSQ